MKLFGLTLVQHVASRSCSSGPCLSAEKASPARSPGDFGGDAMIAAPRGECGDGAS